MPCQTRRNRFTVRQPKPPTPEQISSLPTMNVLRRKESARFDHAFFDQPDEISCFIYFHGLQRRKSAFQPTPRRQDLWCKAGPVLKREQAAHVAICEGTKLIVEVAYGQKCGSSV